MLMHDFPKRFCYFDQALYGIDKNGVLHISSGMKKNKEIIDAYNGNGTGGLSRYEAANIIIIQMTAVRSPFRMACSAP